MSTPGARPFSSAPRPRASLTALGCALLLGGALDAQCASEWRSAGGLPGVLGDVLALAPWDPDGAGPAPEVLAVGGDFSIAGGALRRNLALWNPVTNAWSSLGGDADGPVTALTVLPDGSLVAAGSFATIAGVPAARIARWDGSGWLALGSGLDDEVLAVAVGPVGQLIAGGRFLQAGGVAAAHL
ncbi:MAG: delta-60 repeat domain-containing protein, partial [Planctomycetes bacterium]|nr:delta-60 repeat domain-containing protein [Planctomycetota bacterium]